MKESLAFDDVLILPRKCIVKSRSDIYLDQKFLGFNFEMPIISANMSSITELRMLQTIIPHGGLGILHRMISLKDQIEIVSMLRKHYDKNYPIGVSIHGNKNGLLDAKTLIKEGANIVCIDVAHAHSEEIINISREFVQKFPKIPLIIGNIATPEAIVDFSNNFYIDGIGYQYWKDYIAFKVGIGSGSQCTTRIVTGCGIPTLQSLLDIDKLYLEKGLDNVNINLIADGGIKNSGDIMKCFVAGAKMVMLGSLLAGTEETPGNVIKYKNNLYKIYRGSASYGQKYEINKTPQYIEGEETLVPYKGPVLDVLQSLCEGIKSGISYVGCKSLQCVFNNTGIQMVKINNAGYNESTAHGA